MHRSVRCLVLILFLIAAIVALSGCLVWGAGYTVVGTVMEEDTRIPLADAAVRIGSAVTKTDALGYYRLEVSPGVHELEVLVDGYESYWEEIELNQNELRDISLQSNLPPMGQEAVGIWDNTGPLDPEDATDYPAAIVQIYDWRQLLGPDAELDRLELYINGRWQSVHFDSSGYALYWPIPLQLGGNELQLRAWDTQGFARSMEPFRIELTWDRMDFRTVLSWDAPAYINLHVFKREASELLLFDPDTTDRHVYRSNRQPRDFGETPAQNPIMDSWGDWMESVVLEELTPGDYHIFMVPSILSQPVTKATLAIDLDMTPFAVDHHVYEVELSSEQVGEPVHVATIRVNADGTKSWLGEE